MLKTLTQKQITKLAQILPPVETLTQERHVVKGRELIAQGHTKEDGKAVKEELYYEQYMPVVMDISHKRNMKKLFRKYGDAGVMQYFNQIMSKANETTASKS
jgi:hypothetical protein